MYIEGKDDENWVNYIGKAAFKGKSNSGYEWSDIGYVSMLEITDGALLISEDTEYGPELDLWHSLSKKYLTEYELDYISIYDDTINTNVKDFEWKSCITNYDTGETFGDYKVENDHFKYCDYDEKVVDLSKWDEEGVSYVVLEYVVDGDCDDDDDEYEYEDEDDEFEEE